MKIIQDTCSIFTILVLFANGQCVNSKFLWLQLVLSTTFLVSSQIFHLLLIYSLALLAGFIVLVKLL